MHFIIDPVPFIHVSFDFSSLSLVFSIAYPFENAFSFFLAFLVLALIEGAISQLLNSKAMRHIILPLSTVFAVSTHIVVNANAIRLPILPHAFVHVPIWLDYLAPSLSFVIAPLP